MLIAFLSVVAGVFHMNRDMAQLDRKIRQCYYLILRKGFTVLLLSLGVLHFIAYLAEYFAVPQLNYLAVPVGVIALGWLLYTTRDPIKELNINIVAKRKLQGKEPGNNIL